MKFSARDVGWLVMMGVIAMAIHCDAQDNSWTSPGSGNWEDASWSLGLIPGTNQTVLITNAGWKAVQIGAGTAQNFPLSLNVNSIVISSPTNSFNTLLLNNAGSAPPLTAQTLSVASNSAVKMFSSALQINGPNGDGMMVGGEFDQEDNSVVGGSQINVGYIGPGIYHFNSGYLAVSQLWLGGGAEEGVLIQNGGTNGFGITHLDGGTYVLSNGWYGATIYFNGGQFDQFGGMLATDLAVFEGSYVLAGGVHEGSTLVPSQNAYTDGWGSMLQTGGTNEGSLEIASYGEGSYTMSNGVSFADHISIGDAGSYSQFGGIQTVAGAITISEDQVNFEEFEGGDFNLYGGQISMGGMRTSGYYTQTGGTNVVSGDVTMVGYENTTLSVSGGLLAMNNLSIDPGYEGGVFLTGGTVIVTNTLTLGGNGEFPYWQGLWCGGELVVSNIVLPSGATFSCGNGLIVQSGTLTLANASFYSGTNSVQIGPLCLANGGGTNSTLYMVSPTSKVSFGDSSGVAWSNGQVLMVEGWSGSLNGGGRQQIVFGNDASGLTGAQLAQIQFENPAGLAAGTYPAKILASGEIVPDAGMMPRASMAIAPQPSGMQLTLQGLAGRNYSIEVSTDLVHWAAWTNVVNTNGTMRVMDCDATNCPAKFYRARLLP